MEVQSQQQYVEEGISLVRSGGVYMRVHHLADGPVAAAAGSGAGLEEASVYDKLLERDADNHYVLRLTIDPSAYGTIIGRGGSALKSLQGPACAAYGPGVAQLTRIEQVARALWCRCLASRAPATRS